MHRQKMLYKFAYCIAQLWYTKQYKTALTVFHLFINAAQRANQL